MTITDSSITNVQLDTAQRLAMQGFAVFPTVPDVKEPYGGSHGYNDASLDEDRITELWAEHPEGIPAIACGLSDPRLIVLDVDGIEGEQSLLELTDKYGPLPTTRTVRTPRGGWHFYFRRPSDFKSVVPSPIGKIGDGLDIRADTSYAIAYACDGDEPIAEIPECSLR
jgi:Bifunctional DNA primase/polymerase, N-terminal